MTKPQSVPPEYRGRDKMTLVEFIEDVERCHFRTGHDTGANPTALFIWNIVRGQAGMDMLTKEDLIQRHADDKGISLEAMQRDYAMMDRFRELRKDMPPKEALTRVEEEFEVESTPRDE